MFRFLVLISAFLVLVATIVAVHDFAARLRPTGEVSSSRVLRASTATSIPPTEVPVTVVVASPGPSPTPIARPHPTATVHPQPETAVLAAGGPLPPNLSEQPVVPIPQAAPGSIRLTNYWINRRSITVGELLALTYVIDNTTGMTARVWLGASLMPASDHNWAADAINDQMHDVVAVAPPGLSTHLRYFTVRRGLHIGLYDVAWGLLSLTHRPLALVTVPEELAVHH